MPSVKERTITGKCHHPLLPFMQDEGATQDPGDAVVSGVHRVGDVADVAGSMLKGPGPFAKVTSCLAVVVLLASGLGLRQAEASRPGDRFRVVGALEVSRTSPAVVGSSALFQPESSVYGPGLGAAVDVQLLTASPLVFTTAGSVGFSSPWVRGISVDPALAFVQLSTGLGVHGEHGRIEAGAMTRLGLSRTSWRVVWAGPTTTPAPQSHTRHLIAGGDLYMMTPLRWEPGEGPDAPHAITIGAGVAWDVQIAGFDTLQSAPVGKMALKLMLGL